MSPKVTVITATYNSSRTLRYTIQSVLKQDFQDFEYWIIGDSCTDDSEEVVRSFDDPRVKWHNLSSNSGSQAIPNNAGLERALGAYIAYIGHDDLWCNNHLSSLLAVCDIGSAKLAHSLTFLIGPEGLRNVYGALGRGRNYTNFSVAPSSWMHSRSPQRWQDARKIGRAVDNDFFWRCHRSGLGIVSTGKPTLLKFPSSWWGLYKREENFPQVGYWQRLSSGTDEWRTELLLQAAILLAQRHTRFLTVKELFKESIKPLGWLIISRYPNALYFLFQAFRQYQRKLRGLPAER